MSGCALIEYNNRTARIRGEVAQGDIFSMLSLTGLSLQSGFAIQTIILPDCRLMSGLKELQNK